MINPPCYCFYNPFDGVIHNTVCNCFASCTAQSGRFYRFVPLFVPLESFFNPAFSGPFLPTSAATPISPKFFPVTKFRDTSCVFNPVILSGGFP